MASECHSKGISRIALGLDGVFARPDFDTAGSASRIWRSRLLSVRPVPQFQLLDARFALGFPLDRLFPLVLAKGELRARRALFHLTIVSTLIASALAF